MGVMHTLDFVSHVAPEQPFKEWLHGCHAYDKVLLKMRQTII